MTRKDLLTDDVLKKIFILIAESTIDEEDDVSDKALIISYLFNIDLEDAIMHEDTYEMITEYDLEDLYDQFADEYGNEALVSIPRHLQYYFDEDLYKKDIINDLDVEAVLTYPHEEIVFDGEYLYVYKP